MIIRVHDHDDTGAEVHDRDVGGGPGGKGGLPGGGGGAGVRFIWLPCLTGAESETELLF